VSFIRGFRGPPSAAFFLMMNIRTHPGVLKTLPLFSLLTPSEFRSLLPTIQQRSYRSRALILRAGDEPDGFYFILSGRVKIFIESPGGRQVLLSVLGPNDLFGEMELIDHRPRCATVEAYGACRVIYIPQKAFTEAVMPNLGAATLLLRTVVERLRNADEKLHQLVFLNVYERVALTLLNTSHEKNGEWVVGPGSEQIATIVGSSREMVSRVLRRMLRLGIIGRQRRQLTVLDRTALRKITLRERDAAHENKAR
jgi:CRP/FNR family cyclic AMP-dependent transcriptional regulator